MNVYLHILNVDWHMIEHFILSVLQIFNSIFHYGLLLFPRGLVGNLCLKVIRSTKSVYPLQIFGLDNKAGLYFSWIGMQHSRSQCNTVICFSVEIVNEIRFCDTIIPFILRDCYYNFFRWSNIIKGRRVTFNSFLINKHSLYFWWGLVSSIKSHWNGSFFEAVSINPYPCFTGQRPHLWF